MMQQIFTRRGAPQSWDDVLKGERDYMLEIWNKVEDLAHEAQGDAALSQMHAGALEAYNAGIAALNQLEADIARLLACANGQPLTRQDAMILGQIDEQNIWPAIQLLIAMRLCNPNLPRPSQVCAAEWRRQAQAFLRAWNDLLRQSHQDYNGFCHTMQELCMRLAAFEQMPVKPRADGLKTAGLAAVAGVSGYALSSWGGLDVF